jgi:alcohol dehydrogenase class IV
MPSPFALERLTPLLFGDGRALDLPAECRTRFPGAARLLVVCDRALAATAPVEAVLAALGEARFELAVFAEIVGDPTAAVIDAAAALGRARQVQLVIGIGGGSALDTAKLAAATLAGPAGCEAYALCATPLPPGTPPIVALPTTAGTGAEVTRTAVFTRGDGHKVWAWGEALRPALAVLDPALVATLPRHLVAWTGLDALVHAIEAATARRADPVAEAWALHAIRLTAAHLEAAVSGTEPAARGAMLVAAAFAGYAIDRAGTGVAHALGHALGGLGRIHHGRAVALALDACLEAQARTASAAHAAVATALGTTPDALAGRYAALLDRVAVGRDLGDAGLGPERAAELAALAQAPENRPMLENAPCTWTASALEQAARSLLRQDRAAA